MNTRSTERLTDIRDRLTIGGWIVALGLLLAAASVWPRIAAVALQ